MPTPKSTFSARFCQAFLLLVLLPLWAWCQAPPLRIIPGAGDVRLSKYDIKSTSPAAKKTAGYHYHVGKGGLREGYLGMAHRHLTKAIQLDSTMAMAYSQRGWVHWLERRHDPALADFSQALRIDPFIEEAWQGRALVYRDQWQLTLADADLTHALSLDENDTLMLWLRAGMRQARGEKYEALKDYQTAYTLDSGNCLFELELAFSLLENGMFSLAEKHFDALVQAGPCWHDALRGKLLCLLRAGRTAEADAYVARSQYPQFNLWMQSILAHEAGLTGRALELEKQFIEKEHSKLGWFHYTSGHYALQRGDRELAEKRLLTALRWGDFHIKVLARVEIEKGGFKIPKGMRY